MRTEKTKSSSQISELKTLLESCTITISGSKDILTFSVHGFTTLYHPVMLFYQPIIGWYNSTLYCCFATEYHPVLLFYYSIPHYNALLPLYASL